MLQQEKFNLIIQGSQRVWIMWTRSTVKHVKQVNLSLKLNSIYV